MNELYEDFAEDRNLNGEDPISYPCFARMWREHRSTVKPKSGGTFMKYHSFTLYKETRFGAPGIRATTDPAVLADATAAHDKHLKEIELDRACLLRDEQRAMEAKSNRDPLKFVNIQADAAPQTPFALSMLSPVTHGTDKG